MQPINGNIPMYPSCFDQLAIHGIVANDVMGYITGTPSPYLQNYIAQRGGAPTLPGQVLPDALQYSIGGATTPTQNGQPLPQGGIYNINPQDVNQNILEPKNKKNMELVKKIATGVFLTGITILGIVKGKTLFTKGKALFNKLFKGKIGSIKIPAWINNAKNAVTKGLSKAWNFVKTQWNKLFHKTPTP